MKKPRIPNTDSIQKLAEFWDTHDSTDFDYQLEEVTEPVFVRGTAIKVHLKSPDAEAVARLAREKGDSQEDLIRTFVQNAVRRRRTSKRAPVGHRGRAQKVRQ